MFDNKTLFFRPRFANGSFAASFDAFRWGGAYTEAGPWQYDRRNSRGAQTPRRASASASAMAVASARCGTFGFGVLGLVTP
jgi:hypothetical protein